MAFKLLLSNAITETYKSTSEAISEVDLVNKVIIRKTLVEMMKQSFFHGSNKYGNNFIA